MIFQIGPVDWLGPAVYSLVIMSMTARQFRSSIDKLGLTQLAAARMLGCNARTARRYVLGERSIPPAVEKLLKLALAGKITIEEIERA